MAVTTYVPGAIGSLGTRVVRIYKLFLNAQASENTRRMYAHVIELFCAWVSEQNVSILDVDNRQFRAYAGNLASSYAIASQRVHLAALHGLYQVFVTNEIIIRDPTRPFKLKASDGQRDVLTQEIEPEALENLLREDEVRSWQDWRNLTMIRLTVEGVKSDELLKLQMADIGTANDMPYLVLRHRADKSYFHLSTETARCLEKYVNIAGLSKSSDHYLFLGSRGGNSKNLKPVKLSMHRASLNDMVKKWGRRKKLSRNLTLRVLRATGIRLNLRAGQPIPAIAQQFGIAPDQVSMYLGQSGESLLYEGGIEGLLALLSTTTLGPLQHFIEQKKIFRLSVRPSE